MGKLIVRAKYIKYHQILEKDSFQKDRCYIMENICIQVEAASQVLITDNICMEFFCNVND